MWRVVRYGVSVAFAAAWVAAAVARPAAAVATAADAGRPAASGPATARGETAQGLFARDNLVAWCIVPFDARKRTPDERADLLKRLGFTRFAYDWRAEHVPTFDAEIAALKARGVALQAFWFPGSLDKDAKAILAALARNDVHPELWVTAPDAAPKSADQNVKVEAAAKAILPIAEAAAAAGCKVGLYNHGGWGGEPENLLAVVEKLNRPNVGVVYNFHHGHDHVDRIAAWLPKLKPHLLAVNLNGMDRDGEKLGKKLLPLGQGELDLSLLKAVRDSGYAGPIGILGHTQDDAEDRLKDNLDGLDWLVPQLDGKPAGPKPTPRTMKPAAGGKGNAGGKAAGQPTADGARGEPSASPAFGLALRGGMAVEGKPEFRSPPITVQLRAKLDGRDGFNILVASEAKTSANHWELFTWPRTGALTAYLPGMTPDHVRSAADVCDGQWHAVAMTYEPSRVRLLVDGKVVAEQAVATKASGADRPGGGPIANAAAAGGLAFGRLAEGGLGCAGLVDDVRVSRGVRDVANLPSDQPLRKDDATLGLWSFDHLPRPSGPPAATRAAGAVDYWAVEDPAERAKLPPFYVVPAADPAALTAAIEPDRQTFATWHRSHGDNGSARFSALDQITAANVKDLQVAWTYRSGDGKANVQCNPIAVNGVVYGPTAGGHVVAIDGATGKERWRFKPDGRPAHRGLLYWDGHSGGGVGGNGGSVGRGAMPSRILFTAGNGLYALDPATGRPIAGFGSDGRLPLPGVAAAGPAVFGRTIVIPGFLKDVWAYDLVTGEQRWVFHTVPYDGEFGADTWDRQDEGANCWGGMALDDRRGIAYVTTGSPKPNFVGTAHRGQNLFANCVVAIDVRTGRRLWHFQEIPHDIWDLDIPSPPNLLTITRDGRRVDVVAATTKIGNTLLLDRVTGQPVFPFRMRRAPVSDVPGELTWPYQPDVEWPQPFTRQEFTLADVTDRTEEAGEFVRQRVASARLGWFLPATVGKHLVYFGTHGGAEWTGASVDPFTGHLYVTANEVPWTVALFRSDEPPEDKKAPPTAGRKVYEQNCMVCHGPDRMGVGVAPPLKGLSTRLKDADVAGLLQTGRNLMPANPAIQGPDLTALLDFLFLRDRPAAKNGTPPPAIRPARPQYAQTPFSRLLDQEGYPASKPPWGTLNCLDLNTGKLLWKVPLGEHEELTLQGVPKTGTENFGGATATAGGLVFVGGTRDERIRAFDRTTGAELWSAKLPFGGHAPPAVYQAGGRQYVVIAATGGGKLGTPAGDAYVAFALPASAGSR
jgi:quinoprotein glucose dehydrogenase